MAHPMRGRSDADFPDTGADSASPVLLSGGNAAANVSLGLIFIQNQLNLSVESRIDSGKSILEILMYGAFGNTERFCSAPDCGFVLNHIEG